MKKIKKIIALALTLSLSCIAIIPVYADEVEDDVIGQVLLSIEMSEDEWEIYRESMCFTYDMAVESFKEEIANTDDQDKINYLYDLIDNTQNADPDTIAEVLEDGTVRIDIPHSSAEVEIEGIVYSTDEDGYYYIGEDEAAQIYDAEDSVTATLYRENSFVDEVTEIEFAENNDNVVRLTRTLDELGEGIQRMGESMDQAEGQVTIVTYAKKASGQYYGAGVGKSRIWRDTNIVGCNKHDTSTSSITASQFALQSSDCSSSVKLGISFMAGALGNAYYLSSNCVYEAVANAEGKDNSYCDGSKKSNGKTNCSWFTGIGHTESFHTHKW